MLKDSYSSCFSQECHFKNIQSTLCSLPESFKMYTTKVYGLRFCLAKLYQKISILAYFTDGHVPVIKCQSYEKHENCKESQQSGQA